MATTNVKLVTTKPAPPSFLVCFDRAERVGLKLQLFSVKNKKNKVGYDEEAAFSVNL